VTVGVAGKDGHGRPCRPSRSYLDLAGQVRAVGQGADETTEAAPVLTHFARQMSTMERQRLRETVDALDYLA